MKVSGLTFTRASRQENMRPGMTIISRVESWALVWLDLALLEQGELFAQEEVLGCQCAARPRGEDKEMDEITRHHRQRRETVCQHSEPGAGPSFTRYARLRDCKLAASRNFCGPQVQTLHITAAWSKRASVGPATRGALRREADLRRAHLLQLPSRDSGRPTDPYWRMRFFQTTICAGYPGRLAFRPCQRRTLAAD